MFNLFKVQLFSFILLFLFVSTAQSNSQQNMMMQMQGLMTCMQSVDPQAMQALQMESMQFVSEVKGLCQQGKDSQAQQKALVYSKKMLNNPSLKTLRGCFDKIPPSVKAMMPDMGPEEMIKDYSTRSVCNEFPK